METNKKVNKLAYFSELFGIYKIFPKASGTIGTLVGVIIAIALFPLSFFSLMAVAIFLLFLANYSLKLYFKYNLNSSFDPKEVISDEFVGITTFIPFLKLFSKNFKSYIKNLLIFAAFFRIFDIFKFSIVKKADEKSRENPIFIIIDDLLAAIFAITSTFLFNLILLFFKEDE